MIDENGNDTMDCGASIQRVLDYENNVSKVKLLEYLVAVSPLYLMYLLFSNGLKYVHNHTWSFFAFHIFVWLPMGYIFYKKLVPLAYSPLVILYEYYEKNKAIKYLNKRMNLVNGKLEWINIETYPMARIIMPVYQ